MFDPDSYRFTCLSPCSPISIPSGNVANDPQIEQIEEDELHMPPVYGHQATVIGKYLFITGGVYQKKHIRDVYVFDLDLMVTLTSKHWN